MEETHGIIDQFKKERAKAMLSLDLEKVKAYARKWKAKLPERDDVLLIAIHKARTAMTDLALDARKLSKDWLIERGHESWDDGDL